MQESLRMRCKTGLCLLWELFLAAVSLARPECILELTKLPGQPSSKFVNWKCRMSFTSLPFLIDVSRLDFAWFYARRFLLQQTQRSLLERRSLSEAEAAPAPCSVCVCVRAASFASQQTGPCLSPGQLGNGCMCC